MVPSQETLTKISKMTSLLRILSDLNLRRRNKIVVRHSSQDISSASQSQENQTIPIESQIAKIEKAL